MRVRNSFSKRWELKAPRYQSWCFPMGNSSLNRLSQRSRASWDCGQKLSSPFTISSWSARGRQGSPPPFTEQQMDYTRCLSNARLPEGRPGGARESKITLGFQRDLAAMIFHTESSRLGDDSVWKF